MTANKINKQKIIFGYDYFFPSGPLPNALDFDATLLNLINSKHQNAKRGSSIFTSPQLFHTNILGMVRGNPVHHWPVTEYSNLQAANYWDILDIQLGICILHLGGYYTHYTSVYRVCPNN